MLPGSGEHPIAEGLFSHQLSRRGLLRAAAQEALALVGIGRQLAEYEVLKNIAGAAELVGSALLLRGRLTNIRPAYIGNVAELISEFPLRFTAMGDSAGVGCTDNDHAWTPPAQVVGENIDTTLKRMADIQPPPGGVGKNGYYCQWFSTAQAGKTIQEVREQIEAYRVSESAKPAWDQAQFIHLSAGGNDAIAYLVDHLRPGPITSLMSDFTNKFLPKFQADYTAMLGDVVALANIPAMRNLRHIFLTGIPNLSQSMELPELDVPGARLIAWAACTHINYAIYQAQQDAQQHTHIGLQYVDTAEDEFGQPIPVGRIHWTPRGYVSVVHKIEAAMRADFPDGGRGTVLQQCQRYHLL